METKYVVASILPIRNESEHWRTLSIKFKTLSLTFFHLSFYLEVESTEHIRMHLKDCGIMIIYSGFCQSATVKDILMLWLASLYFLLYSL